MALVDIQDWVEIVQRQSLTTKDKETSHKGGGQDSASGCCAIELVSQSYIVTFCISKILMNTIDMRIKVTEVSHKLDEPEDDIILHKIHFEFLKFCKFGSDILITDTEANKQCA